MKEDSEEAKSESKGTAALHLQGCYSDGHPLDDVHYLECKIILKGERFNSVENFMILEGSLNEPRRPPTSTIPPRSSKTPSHRFARSFSWIRRDFKLYNNAFILRRRLS